MSKQSIEAGRGHVTLGVDDNPLKAGLDAAAARFQQFGRTVAMIGAGITAAGGAIVAPFLRGLQVFSEWGSSAALTMRQTGMDLAGLQNTAGGLGAELEQMGPALGQMSSFLRMAANGSEEANAALGQMGLTVRDLASLSQSERVERLADALGTVADAGQRLALARIAFGEGAGRFDLSGGSEGIRNRAERALQLGGRPTNDDLAASMAYNRSVREMQLATNGLWREIGAAAAGPMMEFFQLVTSIIVGVRDWVRENRPLLETIFRIADGSVTAGAVIAALGGAIYAASFAFSFMSGAVGIVGGAIAFVLKIATGGLGVFGLLAIVGKAAWFIIGVGVNIATAAMSLFVGALMFAVKGFGILNVFILAYKAVVAMAGAFSAAASLGVMVLNAAMAMLVVKSTAATAGLNLVAAGFLLVGAAALATGAILAGLALLATGGAVLFLGAALISATNNWGVFGAAASESATTAQSAWGRASSAMGNMFSTIGASARTMFTGLVATVREAGAGVMDAMAIGDWDRVWRIIRIGGLLAWEQIKLAALESWNSLKSDGLTAWNAIGDGLIDIFHNVVLRVRILFSELWTGLRQGLHTSAAVALEAFSVSTRMSNLPGSEALADLASQAARSHRMDSQWAGVQGAREINRLRETSGLDAEVRRRQREGRDAEIEAEQRDADAALGPNRERIQAMQGQLGAESLDAWIAREDRDRRLGLGNWAPGAVPGGGTGGLLPAAGQSGGPNPFGAGFGSTFAGGLTSSAALVTQAELLREANIHLANIAASNADMKEDGAATFS